MTLIRDAIEHGTKHDQETRDSENGDPDQLHRTGSHYPRDHHRRPQQEYDARQYHSAADVATRISGAHAGGKLGILRKQSSLDLLKQSLFVLGERHGTPPRC
jgi:hypothetical protein